MKALAPFWMVYGDGQRAPAFQHPSLNAAKSEASRLALAHPDIAFYVLASVGVAKFVQVEFFEIDSSDDGIPF